MMIQPSFFKKDNNTNAAEFKKCLPVNVNTSYVTLAPAIATVEQQRLKPILGNALFDEAATYYGANGTTGNDTLMNELVSLIQMAVVRLAYWDSFDQLAVMMSDSGLSDKNGDNRAYRYQANALKESLQRQGFNYLNSIISYCTEHIDHFTNFAHSEYYAERKQSTIRSMAEYEKVLSISNDFFLFARLRDYISETETMELPFRLGKSLSALLMNHREDERVSTIIHSAQGFVAHWSMAEAVPFLNILMTAQGPVVTNEANAGTNGGKTTIPPSSEQIAALQQRHRDMAERYIGSLVTFCKRNIDTYPEIAEIGVTTEHEKPAGHRNNRGKKTFLV